MLQLINIFLSQNWEITYASTANKSQQAYNLEKNGINTSTIKLNDSSFDTFLLNIQPHIVIFDRFITEEQFGWRVAEISPNTIRILDTEDLHCLRNAREIAIKKNIHFQESHLLNNELAKREIASILRSDLSLIISKYEMDLLKRIFNIDDNLLFYIPFLFNKIDSERIAQIPKFEKRTHIYFIGNFLHKPNYDAVLYLKKEIWPLLKNKLPNVELHIFGAYVSQKIIQLNNPKERFYIKEKLLNINQLKNYKICLAPLRFGAGIKGKLTEAMCFGTPSITTAIGAEGMHLNLKWNGFISSNTQEIINNTQKLYLDKIIWNTSQNNGYKIINEIYNKELYIPNLIAKLAYVKNNLEKIRAQNFIGALLRHHTLKSTKYFSKWIEEKNNKK